MVKKLTAIGNSLGLVLEKPVLELLGINRETDLNITTDGTRLIIEPVQLRRHRVAKAAKKVMRNHDKTFQKLAK